MPPLTKDYPTSFGNVRASVFTVVGPASYTQYTAPTTGGQDVEIGPNSGVKVIDWISPIATSSDGLHYAQVVQIEASTVNGVSLGRTKFVLNWYVIATGSEVAGAVDLSTTTVTLFVLGQK